MLRFDTAIRATWRTGHYTRADHAIIALQYVVVVNASQLW